MEDDLNILENGRQLQNLANGRWLQYFGKWKTTSISWLIEDDNDNDDDDDDNDDEANVNF